MEVSYNNRKILREKLRQNQENVYKEIVAKKYKKEQSNTTQNQQTQVEETDKGNFLQRIGSTIADIPGDVLKGVVGGLEGFVEAGAGVVGLFGDDNFKNKIKDFVAYDFTGNTAGKVDEFLSKHSYINDLPENVQNTIHNVGEGVGEMVPSLAANYFAPGIGMPIFMTQAAGHSFNEALSEGADYNKALLYGGLSGVAEGGIEYLSGKIGGTNMLQKGAIGKMYSGGLRKIAKSYVEEGMEEVTSDYLNPLLKAITYSGKYETPELKQVINTFNVGGLTALALGGSAKAVSNAVYSKEGSKVLENIQQVQNLNEQEIQLESVNKLNDEQRQQFANERLRMANEIKQTLDTMEVKSETSQRAAKTQARTRDAIKIDSTVTNEQFTDQIANFDARKTLAEEVRVIYNRDNNDDLKIAYVKDVGINGLYDRETNTIVIDENSKNPYSVVLGHELVHRLEKKIKYKNLSQEVLNSLDPIFLRQERDKLRKIKAYRNLSIENINKEVVANYVSEHLFSDFKSAKKFLTKNKKLGTKILDFIKEKLSSISKSGKEYKELLKIKRTFEEVLIDSEEVKTKKQTKTTKTNSTVKANNLKTVDVQYSESNNKTSKKDSKNITEEQQTKKEESKKSVSTDSKKIEGFDNYTEEQLKNEVKTYVEEKLHEIDDYDTKIVDIKLYGSRTKGTSKQTSDLDVIVEFKGNIKEDSLFNLLHEDDFEINGIKIDINPITESKTGKTQEFYNKTKDYGLPADDDVQFSISEADSIEEGQLLYYDKQINKFLNKKILKEGQRVMQAMVDVMKEYASILPQDKIGKTVTKNSSYDRSVENTTICLRTLTYNEFIDRVQDKVGRPLSQNESMLVSQKIYEIAKDPQCIYCYVSLDRKAYNTGVLKYFEQRDATIKKWNESDKKSSTRARDGKLYTEFLNGRKDTKHMWRRFNMWLDLADSGEKLLTAYDVRTEKLKLKVKEDTGTIGKQYRDMNAYAQSSSQAKIQKDYVAYRDEILKFSQKVVNELNSHYGLRWYSFSDYSAAFIVENMQQITDASIKGLKGLAYTKDTDFAKIFAPTGMGINISVFVNQKEDGSFYIDERQSANIEESIELRKKYKNVGIVAVATNDEAVLWALKQEWTDVVIPFHIVRTGTDIAKFYKWINYTRESSDTVADENMWQSYVDSLGKKKASKNIYPNEHKNNKSIYLKLIKERGLSPRFERFLSNPNYMKLVNETRLSADEYTPLQPIFDLEESKKSFQKFIDKGGYWGSWYEEEVDVDAEVDKVVEAVREGVEPDEDYKQRMKNRRKAQYRKHGASPSNIQYSISEDSSESSIAKVNTVMPKGKESVRSVVKESWKNKNVTMDRIARALFDAQYNIEKYAKTLGVEKEISPLINSARSSKNAAQSMLDENQYDFNGKKVGDGFKKIMDPINAKGITYKNKLFTYMLHYHNIDRMNQGKPKPVFGEEITADMSEEIIAKMEKENPRLLADAKKIWKYQDNLIQYRVDSGLITPKLAEKLRQTYPHYVPTFREGDFNISSKGLSANVSINKTVKKAKGSNKDIISLDVSIARQTMQVVSAAKINKLANSLYEASLNNEYYSEIKVLNMRKMKEVDLDELKDEGLEENIKFYKGGKEITIATSEGIYEGFKALRPNVDQFINPLNTFISKSNTIFKKLVTEYNPFFLVRNAIRDLQDAGLYSKHSAAVFGRNLAKAYKEISSKGKYYQLFEAAGGLSSSLFNYETAFNDEGNKNKILATMAKANAAVELAPRLAEFISSIEAGESIDNALLDAHEVTVNFGKTGLFTKKLNSTLIPFLNAAVQGFIKMKRVFLSKKTIKQWSSLLTKAVMFAIIPAILNNLLYEDDEDYQSLTNAEKENYYLFKIGDEFLKIPKGRVLSIIGGGIARSVRSLSGEEGAFKGYVDNALSQITPVDTMSRTILSPIFRDLPTNTTWYGGEIENASLQNLPVKERYDASTSELAKILGNIFNYSPKKIHYLLDQYTGVIGDIVLPLTDKKADKGIVEKNFFIDPVNKNKYSEEFYDLLEEVTQNKNANSDDMYLKARFRYLNKINTKLSKLYESKREIQNSDLPSSDKLTQADIVQATINATIKTSLKGYKKFASIIEKYPLEEETLDEYYREATRECFGAEIALLEYNSNIYEKATIFNKAGIDWDTFYCAYFDAQDISPDYDDEGESITGTKKIKVAAYVKSLKLTPTQKYMIMGLLGYSNANGKAQVKAYLIRKGFKGQELKDMMEMCGYRD